MKTRQQYRFHLLGLVHLPVSEIYMGCAFTQKILKMSKMLLSLGHEVYLYGAEGSDAPCTEFIQTHTLKDIRDEWGEGDNRPECNGLGYDWRSIGFRHDFNTERAGVTRRYYQKAIEEINERKKDDDFLLVMQGQYQKPIADAVGLYMTLEPGIGYRGSYARFRAFESAYLQNFTYGSENPFKSVNGHYYDRVIPNYFDAKDFPMYLEEGWDKEDYYLFVGRMIVRKGVFTAIKATEAAGQKLVLAGQMSELEPLDISGYPHVEYIGYVDPGERARLMGQAKAVFVPTLYLEAFGGVNVESQLCGTPAITTNFGVFPETVTHGVTGFLCDTFQDFVDAVRVVEIGGVDPIAGGIDPWACRAHAERYLMDNVRHEFQKWFDDIYQQYLSATEEGVLGWWHYE